MAQFRELEAFAKFGSDLDKSTLQQLKRGKIMVEILKQNQYVPMPIANQITVIYAGVNGFMDELEIEQIASFETALIDHLSSTNKKLLDTISSTGKLDDATMKTLKDLLTNFVKTFKA